MATSYTNLVFSASAFGAGDSGSSSTDEITNTGTVTVYGTCTVLSVSGPNKIWVSPSGQSNTWVQAVVDASGNWHADGITLTAGVHTMYVAASNNKPSGTAGATALSYNYDNVAPVATIDHVIDNDPSDTNHYTGFVDYGTPTNDHTPLLVGQADPFSTVQIFNFGSPLIVNGAAVTAQADATGHWQYQFTTPLGDEVTDPIYLGGDGGNYSFAAVVTDVAGNTGQSGGFPITITADLNAVCYLKGTHIQTPEGEVAVEKLQIGDLVTTASGKVESIKWIGRRGYVTRFLPSHNRRNVLPIRIARGALGENIPHRDLFVSPEHAMCLEGALIPARHLVNGRSIAYFDSLETIEYYHIELPKHAVLMAEGAAAESWLDCSNRNFFMNVTDYLALGLPDQSPTEPCLPFVNDGPLLDQVRAQLQARAAEAGFETTTDPDVHLVVNGQRVNATTVDRNIYRFELPSVPASLLIGSRSVTPADLNPQARDTRQLGVSLARVVLRSKGAQLEIGHDHSLLAEGFHADEASHRWTNGAGIIAAQLLGALAGPVQVELHLAALTTRYPKASGTTAAASENGQAKRRAVGHLRLAA